MKSNSVIGIDLGGTSVRAALFDMKGNIMERERHQLEGRKGRKVAVLIRSMITDLLEKAALKGLKVPAAGIGVPGIYHTSNGRVWAPNIPQWESYPLREEMEAFLKEKDVTIHIDSDRSCYILGEIWRGGAKGCRNAIFLAVGTGIGAGILADGRILRGAGDVAGAVGWMILRESGIPFEQGSGHFEFHASGAGLENLARQFFPNGEEMTTRTLFKAYEAGIPKAMDIIGVAVEFWGRAVANLVSIFNPEKIIFGGGVFGPASGLIDDIRKEAERWAQPISMKQVSIEVSRLGDDAGLYGAGYLALEGAGLLG